eukprot:Clim_evm22s2 gene=Clim_evmTU22s2
MIFTRVAAYRRSAVAAVVAGVGAGASYYMYNSPVQAKGNPTKGGLPHYKYVIIGAGVSARTCMHTLNKIDPTVTDSRADTGRVLMVGNDPRMNSIGYTIDDRSEIEKMGAHPDNEVYLGHLATSLDIFKKTLTLNDGKTVSFDKCFIATGGAPPSLGHVSAEAKDRVVSFRTNKDVERIQKLITSGSVGHVTVVGGGFLGTEISLALQKLAGDKKLNVTQMYAEPGVLYKFFPEYLRAYVTARLRDHRVEQRNFSLCTGVSVDAPTNKVALAIESWEQTYLMTDLVIFAPTNIDANTDLASSAGLEIDESSGGILVNQQLCAFEDIYVGGDAASYPNPYLGRRRDQNYDHAVASGIVAAKNMYGERVVYDHIPMLRSRLPAINLDQVMLGRLDAKLENLGLWEMSRKRRRSGEASDSVAAEAELTQYNSRYKKGVVCYFDQGKIVGVLMVNLEDPDEIDKARKLIEDGIDYTGLETEDLVTELRDRIAHELQLPVTKHTVSRSSQEHLRKSNVYKIRRGMIEDSTRVEGDFLPTKRKRSAIQEYSKTPID